MMKSESLTKLITTGSSAILFIFAVTPGAVTKSEMMIACAFMLVLLACIFFRRRIELEMINRIPGVSTMIECIEELCDDGECKCSICKCEDCPKIDKKDMQKENCTCTAPDSSENIEKVGDDVDDCV